MPRRSRAPIWLMGLGNATFGMYSGVIVIAVPQLLSARHVPESTIASMTAVMVSPGFWGFVFSPILDVRFSRRWYSVATALAASLLFVLALVRIDHLIWVEVLLTIGYFFACLYQSALGGWLASITTAEEENRLSAWVTVGNIGGGGLMAMTTGELVRNLSPGAAALLLGAAILLPISIFPFMQAPGPDRRLARESFGKFFGEVLSLLKRREVLIAIALFLAPAATFSLTNFLAGLGADFHASGRFVGLVAGAGVMLGGTFGCLLFPRMDRLLPLRPLYLAIGAAGAVFTLALLTLPLSPAAFAIAMIGENAFQGLAITASTAIAFETIGRDNPLSATTFCVMVSAYNAPITYMLFVDGAGYEWRGVAGSLLADAAVSFLACIVLAALLRRLSHSRARGAALQATVDD